MPSIWENYVTPRKADVLIVGAGFSGLWTAFFLKKKSPKLRLLLIDNQPVPNGASSRNAGFACFGSAGEILMNAATMGQEKALYWSAERWHGLQLIKTFFGNAVEFDLCGGFEVFNDDETFQKSLDYLPELNRFFAEISGNKTVYETTTFPSHPHFQKALKNAEEGSLHSGKLLKALTDFLLKKGVQIYRGIAYQEHQETAEKVIVKTSAGEFSASQLVLAMNAFSPPNLHIAPGRGQVLLTKPIENQPFKGTFHLDNGYTYFRNVGDRILLGGGRNLFFEQEKTTIAETTENVQQYLEDLLTKRLFPNKKIAIESRWAGIMGFTPTHEPIAERRSSRVSIIAGMNGMGVALAPRLGQRLAAGIAG